MANGIKLRGLVGDVDRVSVQSSEDSSYLMTRRRFNFLPAQWSQVSIARDELKVLKCNDGTAVVEIKHLGGPHGDLLLDYGGERRYRIRDGQVLRVQLERNKAVFLRCQDLQFSKSRGAHFLA